MATSDVAISHVVPRDDLHDHYHGYPSRCPCAPTVVERGANGIDGSPLIGALMIVHNAFDGRPSNGTRTVMH